VKIKTPEAAKRLGVHPAILFFYLLELEPSLEFDDVWPEVDEAWIETLAVSRGSHVHQPEIKSESPVKEIIRSMTTELSKEAIHVIDKLRRGRKWGHAAVTLDALKNITHLGSKELQQALDELRKHGFLDLDGDIKGTISLNPTKTREIESIH
jgi:hypothetical protein